MSVTPLWGRCANCGAEEHLSRIAEGAGACPFCHLPFCDDDELFLRQVLRADVAYRLLIRSLRQLSAPAVNLHVLPEPLFDGLVSVPWPERVHPDPEVDCRAREIREVPEHGTSPAHRWS